MKKVILFLFNFLLCQIFGLDILAYYIDSGIHIINNDVNRVFIMWFGFIITLFTATYLLTSYLYTKTPKP